MSGPGGPGAEAQAQFAEVLRRTWTAIARATRAMEHLPTLPSQQVEVLHRLTDADGLTPAQLAAAMRLSRPTVSELTRKMVKDDLIERLPSTSDGRSVVLVPTESARHVLEAFRHGLVEVVAEGLRLLPARDTRRLLGDLPALTQLLGQLETIADAATSEQERRFA